MKSAQEHYDTHLARIYTWLLGGADSARRRASAELADMGVNTGEGAWAVDLGAGPGLHSAALAELGYRVLAIDTCAALLEELRERCQGLEVRAEQAELDAFADQLAEPAALIVCLGDTLTHLATPAAVAQLIDRVCAALAPGGLFVASFRDYVGRELRGDERYILVKRDEDRVLTCFLEYAPGTVTVHDILTERHDQRWQQTESSYQKLRLDPSHVLSLLTARGLDARLETAPGGMVRVVACKPRAPRATP